MIYLEDKIAHMSIEGKPVMEERKLGSRVTVMLRGGLQQPKECKEKQCSFCWGDCGVKVVLQCVCHETLNLPPEHHLEAPLRESGR